MKIKTHELVTVESVTVNSQVIEFKSNGDEIFTDSLTVARVFEKSHKNVLQSIAIEIAQLKNQQSEVSGFIQSSYTAKNLKRERFYFLSKDAFADLVMNFTGAKAKAWKREYRLAFNKVVESHRGLTQSFQKLEEENALLVEENVRLKRISDDTHRLIPLVRAEVDNIRRDNFDKVLEFFISSGKNEGHFGAFRVNIYESLHTIIVGNVASNILLERFKQGIKSHNSGHGMPYVSDYLVALNYYSREELVVFENLFQEIFRDIAIAIDENPKLTPDIVIESVNLKLAGRLLERRHLRRGDEISRKATEGVHNLVEKTVMGKIPISEFSARSAKLKKGRVFKIQ